MFGAAIRRQRGFERAVLTGVGALLVALAVELVLSSGALAAPANDNFADAQPIFGNATSVSGTTAGATREDSAGEPDHCLFFTDCFGWPGDHTVWYRWTAPYSGSTTIDTCTANVDSILAVYTGTQLDNLTHITDNNNGCTSGFGSKVAFTATAGATYSIVVGDAGGLRENTFTLALAAPAGVPANDDFANAQAIVGSAASVFGTNVGATWETFENHLGSGGSVWYRWTALGTGQTTVDTCATDSVGLIDVFTGEDANSLTEVSSTNSGCPNMLGNEVVFNASAGTAYLIRISCCTLTQGTFTLELSGPANAAPTITPRSPQPGSRIHDKTPLISAFVRDSATDLAKGDIRLFVDGHARTFAYDSATDKLLRSSSEVSLGRHTIKVTAADAQGLKTTRSWSFRVVRR